MLEPGTVDQSGVYGSVLHYVMIFLFMGGAAIIFLYLWKKGRLDMDEEPKNQMLNDDKENDDDRP